MRAMKHSHSPEQHHSDARTSTFAYFRAKLHKQASMSAHLMLPETGRANICFKVIWCFFSWPYDIIF